MSIIKRQYEKFKNENSHNILYRSSVKSDKLKCDCTGDTTSKGDPNCSKCFGTGLVYKTHKYKVRRSDGTSSLETDAIEFEDEPKTYGVTYQYFFDVEAEIKHKDIIIDRQESKNEFELYIVRNWIQANGDGGIPAIKMATATKLHKPQSLIKKGIYDIKKEMDIKKKIEKYINEDALNIIKKYPDKAKESKYVERIIYDILRYEDIDNINNKFINLIKVKYDFGDIDDIVNVIKNTAQKYLTS